ncbi:PGPGW domain-containing protein [Desulfomarina profundi]|nr:PGPGW domain-containing protein [Desulfomarina profundi]
MVSLTGSPVFKTLLQWLVPVSILTFLVSLGLIPWIVGRLSETCFLRFSSTGASPQQREPKTFAALVFLFLRNILGILLFLAGFVMLFLPGQGLLTILIGLLLLSFPGKQKLIHFLVRKQMIRQSLDWIRKKRGKTPFQWPELDE